MRIADISEFYSPYGGVRAHLTFKGRALSRLGHHHLTVAPGLADSNLPLDPAADPAGLAQVALVAGPSLPYDANYQLLYRIDKVRRALHGFRPDVVCVNSLYLANLAVRSLPAELAPLRVINWHADFIDTYLRGMVERVLPMPVASTLTESIWKMVVHSLNRYAATFVASRCQLDKLRAHGTKNVVHVPFGVDREIFRPAARSAELRRVLLEGHDDAKLLVAVGRLSSEKGWPTVLQAVARLSATRPVQLRVWGRGPELEHLRKYAPASVVRFMGFEADRRRLAEAIASSDAFVHGCAHETYGFGVAEAVACGVPIVAPSAGAAQEHLDASHSELYEPDDSAACAAALERVLGASYDRYREYAKAFAEQVPDCNAQVAKTVDHYEQLRRAGCGSALEALQVSAT